MNGGLWEHIGGKKAFTLPGSQARWSIGAKEADGFPYVVVTEGGPDLLAAHHFITVEGREGDTAAIGMMESGNDFLESALLYLANKRVRIFPHLDTAGTDAAVRWAEQLGRVGCEVDAFSFDGLRQADGQPVKDLNDLAPSGRRRFRGRTSRTGKDLAPMSAATTNNGAAVTAKRIYRPALTGLPDSYYDSAKKCYWIKDARGVWIEVSEVGVKRLFRSAGVAAAVPKGKHVSPLDLAVLDVQLEKNVAYAASLAGHTRVCTKSRASGCS